MPRPHKIVLDGLELVPHLSGALHVPELATLVVSDLHLEQGTSLARRGIRVPPFDSHLTIALLERVIEQFMPQRLVFLGDSFHDGQGEERVEASLLQRLIKLAGKCDSFWINGNHDPLPPRQLPGHAADHVVLGSLILRHEPSKLRDGECEIAGHLHPGCAISQRGRRLSGKCFVADHRRLIMPAFGAYTGALSVFAPPYAGLFNHEATQVWMLGREQIYKFPFGRLG